MTVVSANSYSLEARLIPADEFAAAQKLPVSYVIELAERYSQIGDYSASQKCWYLFSDALSVIQSIKRHTNSSDHFSADSLQVIQLSANERVVKHHDVSREVVAVNNDNFPAQNDDLQTKDVINIAEPEPESREAALLTFVENCNAVNAVTPLDLKSLKLLKNKNSVRFFLRRKGYKDLELLKTNKGEALSLNDCCNVLKIYEHFKLRVEEGLPVTSVKELAVRESIQITSFNEMLRYGLEVTADSSIQKLRRLWLRYFNGELGEAKLSAFKSDDFKRIIESRPEGWQKSDRDELKKLFSSIYNKADADRNVEQLKFPNLADGIKRNRDVNSFEAPPEVETYATVLLKLCQQNELSAAMHLLLQESVSTRKSLTTELEWEHVLFDDCFINVRCHETKNGKYTRHVIAPQKVPLLKSFKSWALRVRKPGINGPMRYLFESPKLVDAPISNFDDKFNAAKNAVLLDIENSDLSEEDRELKCKLVKRLTQHKLRKMNKKILSDLNASIGQSERDAGRTPNENVSRAYDDLTDDALVDLNKRKHVFMVKTSPTYQRAMQALFDSFSKGV